MAITRAQTQCYPDFRTKVIRGVNGQAMKCGPKANGCKPGCSGTPLCACGAPCDPVNTRVPAAVGRRDVGSGALYQLARAARTEGLRLKKNPCSQQGRQWGQNVSAAETMAQLRGEAACTVGISGTTTSESQNCAAALLQGRICHDLGGNVGSINNGDRPNGRTCDALEVLPPVPFHPQVQTSKVKLCGLRLPTVKRTRPLTGSELVEMTADCQRRAQQVTWNTDYWCGGTTQQTQG
jgi:hypothetical protein